MMRTVQDMERTCRFVSSTPVGLKILLRHTMGCLPPCCLQTVRVTTVCDHTWRHTCRLSSVRCEEIYSLFTLFYWGVCVCVCFWQTNVTSGSGARPCLNSLLCWLYLFLKIPSVVVSCVFGYKQASSVRGWTNDWITGFLLPTSILFTSQWWN